MGKSIRSLTGFVMLALWLCTPNCLAASILFAPTTPLTGLGQGDQVVLEILFDFSDVLDALGTPVGTIGGDFDGITGPVTLGEVRFEVLARGNFSTVVRFALTSSIGGPWVSADDFPIIDVDYGSVTISGVPLPAAVTVFGSALLSLGVFAGRSRRP